MILSFGSVGRFFPRGLASRIEALRRNFRRRDRRYAVELTVNYRLHGALEWSAGRSENIASGGVLVRCENPPPEERVVEVSFWLPPQRGSERRLHIFFWGRVLRSEELSARRGTMAVQVLRYRTAPRPAEDVREQVGEVRGPVQGRFARDHHRWASVRWAGIDSRLLWTSARRGRNPWPALFRDGDSPSISWRGPLFLPSVGPKICVWAELGCTSDGRAARAGHVPCPLGRYAGICPGVSEDCLV